MKNLIALTAGLSLLTLAACGSEDKADKSDETTAPASETMEQAKDKMSEAMDEAKESMQEMVDELTIDASSYESFKESLANMKEKLTPAQEGALMKALHDMADDGEDMADDAGDKMKDMASNGGDMLKDLYEKIGDKLDGLSFDEIIEKAGS
ncbi:MAG: hypothetical protein EP335_16220 [Alphaproteobacteria bacterium]|nr:MAG: hypothetical protein EP335_16220 [Alphaproteobacteria bacterium]